MRSYKALGEILFHIFLMKFQIKTENYYNEPANIL